MSEDSGHDIQPRRLIEVEAIIVAYAMSRLDARFLQHFAYASWRAAFKDTGSRLAVPPASVKNLRDEFDPLHNNGRQGWHKRPLRPNRQRVLGEFCEVSDQALLEIVGRILHRDVEVRDLVVSPLVTTRQRVENVAERLRTGRLAEEHFMRHSRVICGVASTDLLDYRLEARGFDFGARGNRDLAIEVKGLKPLSGQILFTDHEWHQANRLKDNYWLVVIGAVIEEPRARLIKNPADIIEVASSIRQSAVVSWRANVSVR